MDTISNNASKANLKKYIKINGKWRFVPVRKKWVFPSRASSL